MSDEPKQPAAPEGETQASSESAPEMFPADYVKQLREEAKTYRLQVKEMQSKLQELDSVRAKEEETKLADQARWKELAEKREAELAELKGTLERERMELLKSRISAEFNLPPQLAARLTGSTEEELRADAQGLSELIPAPSQPQTSRQTTQIPAGEANSNREEFLRNWLFGDRAGAERAPADTDGKTYWRFGG